MSFEFDVVRTLVRAAEELIRHYPRQGLLASIAILLAILSFGFILDKAEKDRTKANVSVAEQLQQLNETQRTLKNLGDFIDGQRQQLQESEQILNNLKNEQQQLQPIVESNRDAVTAILQAQAQAQRGEVWWERAFGFVIGVISSLIASFIFAILWNRYGRRNGATNPEGA